MEILNCLTICEIFIMIFLEGKGRFFFGKWSFTNIRRHFTLEPTWIYNGNRLWKVHCPSLEIHFYRIWFFFKFCSRDFQINHCLNFCFFIDPDYSQFASLLLNLNCKFEIETNLRKRSVALLQESVMLQ